tara:strand:+ start:89 stop:388 length:300 start_codon:yes stop_codon:yes gene_type:complete
MAIIANVTTSPATTILVPKQSSWSKINQITIANFSDNTADARVDIYLKKGATDAYLIKNCMIPKGATLVLDDGYYFPNKHWGLYAYSTGTAPALTITVR